MTTRNLQPRRHFDMVEQKGKPQSAPSETTAMDWRVAHLMRGVPRKLKADEVRYRLSREQYIKVVVLLAQQHVPIEDFPLPYGDGAKEQIGALLDTLIEQKCACVEQRADEAKFATFKLTEEGKQFVDQGLARCPEALLKALDELVAKAADIVLAFCKKQRKKGEKGQPLPHKKFKTFLSGRERRRKEGRPPPGKRAD